ncbi:hypothetical protein HKCCE2091_19100 [Rhodobacterales bacterium HKCCE2091]|nr:hypothetical protein [Rhodobacterales bacterium HKCCE2091]
MATINLGSGDDVQGGVAGEENSIAGNAGDDLIIGRGKSDLLLGGQDNDTLKGANGADELYGGSGDDEIYGGNGADTLSGDKGENILVGGNGSDTFVINAAIAGQGHDTIMDFDLDRQNRRMTYSDSLEIKNVAGATIVFQETAGGDVVVEIDGFVVATIKGSEGPIEVEKLLAATEFTGGSPASVSLLDALGDPVPYTVSGTAGDDLLGAVPGLGTTIAGGPGDDTLNGRGKDDVLLGGPGEDELNGANGSDTLYGGGDNDVLVGGNGGDLLNGDRGSDVLTGGNGGDTFQFTAAHAGTGVDTITDYDASEGDVIQIRNGDPLLLTYTDTGDDTEVYYDGELIFVVEMTDPGDIVVG